MSWSMISFALDAANVVVAGEDANWEYSGSFVSSLNMDACTRSARSRALFRYAVDGVPDVDGGMPTPTPPRRVSAPLGVSAPAAMAPLTPLTPGLLSARPQTFE